MTVNYSRKDLDWTFCFSNRVVDNWNCLSACCVSSNTVNTFKKHVSVELEPETVINQRQ